MDWKLTRNAVGEPEVDCFRDDPDEDLALGFTMLRALAEADEQAEQVHPGLYVFRKSNNEKMI